MKRITSAGVFLLSFALSLLLTVTAFAAQTDDFTTHQFENENLSISIPKEMITITKDTLTNDKEKYKESADALKKMFDQGIFMLILSNDPDNLFEITALSKPADHTTNDFQISDDTELLAIPFDQLIPSSFKQEKKYIHSNDDMKYLCLEFSSDMINSEYIILYNTVYKNTAYHFKATCYSRSAKDSALQSLQKIVDHTYPIQKAYLANFLLFTNIEAKELPMIYALLIILIPTVLYFLLFRKKYRTGGQIFMFSALWVAPSLLWINTYVEFPGTNRVDGAFFLACVLVYGSVSLGEFIVCALMKKDNKRHPKPETAPLPLIKTDQAFPPIENNPPPTMPKETIAPDETPEEKYQPKRFKK